MTHFCTLCGTHSELFAMCVGRANVACPTCGSLERYRLTALFLKKYWNFNEKLNVLHFAPEPLLSELFRKLSLNYVCGDFNANRYSAFNAIKIDATEIQFDDNHFDLIYASHILEHIPDDLRAMREMYRVLKRRGKLIALIPQFLKQEHTFEDSAVTTPEERLKLFGQWDHVRMYGRDFSSRLRSVGFNVKIHIVETAPDLVRSMEYDELNIAFNKQEVRYHKLHPSEVLYECSKI